MAWWWTNIRSNTWDDLPSDKDFKSRCVSFWCCLKSLKCFETTNQIKCSQLGKQRQASPKKAQSRVTARIDAARAMRRFASICFYYLHLSMYRMIIHPSIIYLHNMLVHINIYFKKNIYNLHHNCGTAPISVPCVMRSSPRVHKPPMENSRHPSSCCLPSVGCNFQQSANGKSNHRKT